MHLPLRERLESDPDWRPWYWRNCQMLAISLMFAPFPWDWHVRGEKQDQDGMDYLGYGYSLQIGPIGILITATCGNCSSEYRWEATMGLSEQEAWERADDCFQKKHKALIEETTYARRRR